MRLELELPPKGYRESTFRIRPFATDEGTIEGIVKAIEAIESVELYGSKRAFHLRGLQPTDEGGGRFELPVNVNSVWTESEETAGSVTSETVLDNIEDTKGFVSVDKPTRATMMVVISEVQ
jgi:hypothetical protein